MHLANPLLLATLSFATFVLATGSTSSTSKARYAAVILMVGYVVAIFIAPNQRAWFSHPIYPNLAGGSTFNILLHYIDIALIQGWSYETQGSTRVSGNPYASDKKKEKPSGTFGDRLKFGVGLLFNKRLTGTPWQVKNVPPFNKRDPSWVPSRTVFLIKNIMRCAVCLLFLDLIGLAGQDTSRNPILFDEHFVPILTRLSDVTVEEIVVRIMTSAITALSTYLLFQAVYSGSAVVMVGLGLNKAAAWRPLFGNCREITSLRSTWNHFWHQAMGRDLTGPSRYIASKILRLPKGSLIWRYAYIMLVFQLSGLVHIVGDVAAGNDIRSGGAMQWFSIQALGFMIEDGIATLWRTISGKIDDEGKSWQKVIGFLWVVSWMIWTMPVWTYPISRESQGEGILPFSIFWMLSIQQV